MDTIAVVLRQPEQIELDRLALTAPTPDDVVVDVEWSGVSTGTERLLWSGRMPPFPGMGYPLVPGYESVGRVVEAGSDTDLHRRPAASSFPARNASARSAACSAASASRLVVPAKRVVPLDRNLGERGILLALAATAYHAIAARGASAPDCIVGHGVLGRLLARISIALRNEPPTVWEKNPARAGGAIDYGVIDPEHDVAARLQEHLRRQRRCRPARFADRRASRRAARSCWPASTASRCPLRFRPRSCARRAFALPPNGSRPISSRSTALIESGPPFARRADHPPPRRPGCLERLSHRVRGSGLPENGPELEIAAHECRASRST